MKTLTLPTVWHQVVSLKSLMADSCDKISRMRKDRREALSIVSIGQVSTWGTFVMVEDWSDSAYLWPKVYALKDLRKLPKATRNIRVTQSQLALILTSHAMADGLCACA